MSRLSGFLLGCTLVALVGCGSSGPKLYPVTGSVKLDGTPKAKLMVTFTPTAGGLAAVGTTDEKGEFRLQTNGKRGAIEGEHRVSITTIAEPAEPPKVAANAPSGSEAYMNQANIRPQEFKIPKEQIPAKYNKNSELIRTVDGSETKFDFDLSTK